MVGLNTVALPSDATIIDLANKYVIPGLWDMHVHSHLSETDPDWFYPLLIANGVTGIRDMGSFVPLARAQRTRADTLAGKRIGPRMILTGLPVNGSESVNDAKVDIVGTIRALRTLKVQGADFIKISPIISSARYREVIREARALGLVVVGQVPETVRTTDAAASGQGSIEHMSKVVLGCSDSEKAIIEIKAGVLRNMDVRLEPALLEHLVPSPEEFERILSTLNIDRCRRLFAALAKHQTAVVPMLALARTYAGDSQRRTDPRLRYLPRAVSDAWIKTDSDHSFAQSASATTPRALGDLSHRFVRPLREAGVTRLAGTHAAATTPFVFPGFSLHDELATLVGAGISPLEALQTATTAPARFLGQERALGSVAAGYLADLVVLNANPLEDIANTKSIHAVVLNGRLLQRPALDRLLREASDRR